MTLGCAKVAIKANQNIGPAQPPTYIGRKIVRLMEGKKEKGKESGRKEGRENCNGTLVEALCRG